MKVCSHHPLAVVARRDRTAAQAQSEKTREQVKAEYAEAVRTGDVIPAGDAGLKLNGCTRSAIPTRRSPSRYRVRR